MARASRFVFPQPPTGPVQALAASRERALIVVFPAPNAGRCQILFGLSGVGSTNVGWLLGLNCCVFAVEEVGDLVSRFVFDDANISGQCGFLVGWGASGVDDPDAEVM